MFAAPFEPFSALCDLPSTFADSVRLYSGQKLAGGSETRRDFTRDVSILTKPDRYGRLIFDHGEDGNWGQQRAPGRTGFDETA